MTDDHSRKVASPKKRLRLALIAASAGLALVVAVGAAVLLPADSTSRSSGTTGEVTIGGPFTMVNQDGVGVTDEDFRGKYTLLYFGYTNCPDICPTDLQTIGFALDDLGDDGKKITPVFVTTDPDRDTVEVMREYVALFHPRLVGLTGTAADIKQITHVYGIFHQHSHDDGTSTEYLIDHSTTMYLMGPDGKYVTHMRAGMSAEEMVAALKSHL